MQKVIDVGVRTNLFTYSNGLPVTVTDELNTTVTPTRAAKAPEG